MNIIRIIGAAILIAFVSSSNTTYEIVITTGRDRFVGTWELELIEIQQPNGEWVHWKDGRFGPAPIGIGINSGEMVVGNIGCEKRVDYTAIGDAMNLGARLCSLAQPHQVIISESTYQLVKDAVEVNRLAPVRVKGRVRPEQIYEVLAMKK